jgi:Uma2 family endonuclease
MPKHAKKELEAFLDCGLLCRGFARLYCASCEHSQLVALSRTRQIITAPAPLPKHSRAQRSLSRFIGGPFDDNDGRGGPGGWWIFVEVDIAFGQHDVVRPDLAGWRRERLIDPGEQRPITVRPDWTCEVLSPSTAARDKVQKRQLYAEHSVPHYWIIDADARTLEAFSLENGRWVLVGSYDEHACVAISPFDAIEIEIERLFLPRSEP